VIDKRPGAVTPEGRRVGLAVGTAMGLTVGFEVGFTVGLALKSAQFQFKLYIKDGRPFNLRDEALALKFSL
jgi:hypothetical protein